MSSATTTMPPCASVASASSRACMRHHLRIESIWAARTVNSWSARVRPDDTSDVLLGEHLAERLASVRLAASFHTDRYGNSRYRKDAHVERIEGQGRARHRGIPRPRSRNDWRYRPQVDVAITSPRNEAVAREVETAGVRAIAIQSDQADPLSAQPLIGRRRRTFRQVDILVNNAGITVQGQRVDDLTRTRTRWTVSGTPMCSVSWRRHGPRHDSFRTADDHLHRLSDREP